MADQPTENAPAPAAPSGGIKAWLPLIVTVVAMPLLAYGTMSLLILPKMKAATGSASTEEAAGESEAAGGGHGSESEGAEEGGGHGAPSKSSSRKGKVQARLDKMVVNVAGTMGTRFLMASITLVGSKSNFEATVEENKDQLMDLATSTLSSKTISDLEKPGARNLIKTELISVFNNALGGGLVQEIYIPEMAIQ